MGKGCSTSKESSAASSSSAHLAVVDIVGTIDASSNQAVNSEDTNKALKRALKLQIAKQLHLILILLAVLLFSQTKFGKKFAI